jgi:hypothetical protein
MPESKGYDEAKRIKASAMEGRPYMLLHAGIGMSGPHSLDEVRQYLENPWSFEGTVVLKIVRHPTMELETGRREESEGDLVPISREADGSGIPF